MIIDHDESVKAGKTVELERSANDKTMELRVVVPGETAPSPAVFVNYPEAESRWLALETETHPKKSEGGSEMTVSLIHPSRPLINPGLHLVKGVVHPSLLDESDDENTATFALPAVWKITGKGSTTPLAHRTARRVQDTFREAGWNILVWYGEHTKDYWVMDENGLYAFDSLTALYLGMGWEDI